MKKCKKFRQRSSSLHLQIRKTGDTLTAVAGCGYAFEFDNKGFLYE